MKTFKQHLKDLENKRKLKGYFPNVVHGSHASKEEKLKEDVSNDFQIYDKSKSHLDALKEYETENHKELETHHDDIKNHPDSYHLRRYTSASKALNQSLIRGDELVDDHKDRVRGIDNVLNNAKPLPSKTTVFSGLGFDPRNHMDDEGHLTSNAYLSSSTRSLIASSFSSFLDDGGKPTGGMGDKTVNTHVLKIDLPEGSSHGAYIDHISVHRGEDEFLFRRGTKVKVHPVPEVREEDGFLHHIWHATPVG